MLGEGGGLHGDGSSGGAWRLVSAVAHHAGLDEVLVQVIHEFG
jgi:hypothetical protein